MKKTLAIVILIFALTGCNLGTTATPQNVPYPNQVININATNSFFVPAIEPTTSSSFNYNGNGTASISLSNNNGNSYYITFNGTLTNSTTSCFSSNAPDGSGNTIVLVLNNCNFGPSAFVGTYQATITNSNSQINVESGVFTIILGTN